MSDNIRKLECWLYDEQTFKKANIQGNTILRNIILKDLSDLKAAIIKCWGLLNTVIPKLYYTKLQTRAIKGSSNSADFSPNSQRKTLSKEKTVGKTLSGKFCQQL